MIKTIAKIVGMTPTVETPFATFVLVLTLVGTSIFRSFLLTEKLWNVAKPHVRPETKIGCFGYTEPSLVWKFRSIVTNLVTLGEPNQALDFLTNVPPFILVLPTGEMAKLPDTNGLQIRVRGLDMVRFKNRDLTVIVRP